LRSLGVEEWAVKIIWAMYTNIRSLVRVNGQYIEEFRVGVVVHQGSVLSLLLFIIVLEALSREFRSGVNLGLALRWWSNCDDRLTGEMCHNARGMEERHRIEGTES
jgi:hypothetical protein